jgi:hypothetical protein
LVGLAVLPFLQVTLLSLVVAAVVFTEVVAVLEVLELGQRL